MPIFHRDIKQGTTEWLVLRAGIPTASSFDSIITPKGAPSKSAERYLCTLLAERILGRPIVEHVSYWQGRGSDLEASAVNFYEFTRDCETEPIGFVTNDTGTVGASPDRLVDADGLLEVKCPSEWIHMGFLLNSGAAYESYKIQAQGQLLVTGRSFVDFLSWHPEMPPSLQRVERDEPFLKLLAAAVETFSLELERQFELCVARGWVSEKREPPKAPASSWGKIEPLPPLETLLTTIANKKG